jgi:hypothetical protein
LAAVDLLIFSRGVVVGHLQAVRQMMR